MPVTKTTQEQILADNRAWRDESRQPNCGIYGRFATKEYWDGKFIRWSLTCMSPDGDGGWEHD